MTGKLIKHELKAGARRMSNIYIAAGIACLAMLFSAFFKNGFMRFITSAAVVVIAAIAVIVTFASVVFGANKSLFGREGYLTQTLPVRTSSLIFAKWFASSVWVLASYALAAVVFVAVFVYWTTQNQEGAQIYDMIYQFLQGFGVGAESVYQKYLLISAIVGFFNACIFVMYVLFSITVSNINPFHRLGTLGVILYLAGTIFVIQGITMGLEKLCDITLIIAGSGMSMTVSPEVVLQATASGAMTIGFTGVYFKILVTVFLFILTVQLTETKINLK